MPPSRCYPLFRSSNRLIPKSTPKADPLSRNCQSSTESPGERPAFASRRRTAGTSGLLLDGHADQRAVLGPRSVVVLDVLVAEELVQREPGVGGALADPAVRDDLAAGSGTGALVDRAELVRRLEGAVVVRRLGPGNVRRAGDVARNLRLLLRQVIRSELLAPVLLG